MFSPTFDFIVAAILTGLAFVFFMGKGSGILKAFEGKRPTDFSKRKKTPEEERKYQRAIGVFLLVLAASELLLALFPGGKMGLVSAGIGVASLFVIAWYMKKNFGGF